jgi:ribonuclease D
MLATPHDLDRFLKSAAAQPVIALDTEFFWERTFYPILGVVQAAFTHAECFLIDAVALRDLSAFGPVLADPAHVKILHDAEQDLTIIARAAKAFPKNVFDTRRMAGFIGLSCSLSLSDLLRELLGVKLTKTQTRTNWLRRPLSAKQIAYAEDDVRYLPAARAEILRRARTLGREAWIVSEQSEYDNPALYAEKAPEEYYLRLKGGRRLSPRQLAVLRAVAAWREAAARRQDRPRGHIVSDGILMALALKTPQSPRQLGNIQGFGQAERQRYGNALLTAIDAAQALPDADLPAARARPKDPEDISRRIEAFLSVIREKCAAANIDPQLVGSRPEVTALLHEGPTAAPSRHRMLRGWRAEFLREELT